MQVTRQRSLGRPAKEVSRIENRNWLQHPAGMAYRATRQLCKRCECPAQLDRHTLGMFGCQNQ